jgi:hypothetical protein
MPNEVDINELDASDLADILTEVNGKATKVKNVATGRKELAAILETKGLVLSTDDEGNFVLNEKKAKAKVKTKAKAAPEPEPEEDEEETEESEDEEEADEEEAEEEAEEEPAPPPKKSAKAKVKTKAAPAEDEEEAEAPKAKRAPPPREPKIKDDQKITVLKKDAKFQEGTGRAAKWAMIQKCKTVGEFIKKASEAELATPRGFAGHCLKQGYISIT